MSYFHRALRTALMTGIVMTMCVVGASAANVGVGTVNGDGLRLREEANTSASILGRAYTGDKVIVLEEAQDGWYKVNYECVEGYMSAEYLDVTEEFLRDALSYYRGKYGHYSSMDNYVIFFEPSISVLELV